MPVFWLVVLIGATSAPLHVGNFPSLDSCRKAASEIVRGSMMGTAPAPTVGAGSGAIVGPAPNVAYVCVQASTGKRKEFSRTTRAKPIALPFLGI